MFLVQINLNKNVKKMGMLDKVSNSVSDLGGSWFSSKN